jgi:hypothetical protein
MKEIVKPTITTSGLSGPVAAAMEQVKQSVEMITGARNLNGELRGLKSGASSDEIISKINEIIARLNASGRANV